MPAGLLIWDGSGVLQSDYTTRLGRIIGFTTVYGPGSLSADFSGGTGFGYVCNASGNDTNNLVVKCTISGNTMSWSDLGGKGSWPNPVIIMYGVF